MSRASQGSWYFRSRAGSLAPKGGRAEVYKDLVDLYQEEHAYDKVKHLLKKAIGMKGLEHVFLYEKLGRAEEAEGNFRQAIAYYRKGLLESLENADTAELKKHIRRNRYKRFKLRRKNKAGAIE